MLRKNIIIVIYEDKRIVIYLDKSIVIYFDICLSRLHNEKYL